MRERDGAVPVAEPPSPALPLARERVDDAADIGWTGPPAEITAEARRANTDALRLHRAGDFARSRAGFERAVTLAPGYAMARYNLACALSRTGEIDAAARTFEPLLAQDLPTFGPRLRTDPDLADLRAAPSGARLLARADALRSAWARAARQGVPAVWVEGPLDVRPGVYVHAMRRFVPLGPDEHDTLAALYDPASDRSVYLTAIPDYDGISHLTRTRVLVHPADGTAALGEWRSDADFCGVVEAAAIPAGAALRTFNCASSDDTPPYLSLELTAAGVRVTSQTADPPAHDPPRATAWMAASALQVRFATGAPEGFLVRGNDLVVPGRAAPVALGTGHAGAELRSVVVSPAGDFAIVVSVHARCDCEHDASIELHAIDRVELSSGTVTRLSAGASMAAARFGPDVALYVQDGDRVRRWSSPGGASPEPVPPGVLLGVLRFAAGDCCSA